MITEMYFATNNEVTVGEQVQHIKSRRIPVCLTLVRNPYTRLDSMYVAELGKFEWLFSGVVIDL